jgi:predicted nucleotidyltransferase
MRWHAPIDDVLGSKLKVRILRLLFLTRGLYTGREIAKLARYSPTHTIAALKGLEMNGVVNRRHAGNADLYSLNDRSTLVSGVLSPIFTWEQGLLDQLAKLYRDSLENDLEAIEIFGSVARGEEDTQSDVDLLIVIRDGADRDNAEEKVARVSVEAASIFGNQFSPILVSKEELGKKRSRKRGVWKELSEDTITIYPV